MRILIIFLLLFTFGCMHSFPPKFADFTKIHDEEYIVGINDCSNKSAKYARILLEDGHFAELVVLYDHRYRRYNHCVVLTFDNKGNSMYCCPTNFRWGNKVLRGYKRKEFISYDKRFEFKDGEFEFKEFIN